MPPPNSSPSATTIKFTNFFRFSFSVNAVINAFISVLVSGINIFSAPVAIPLCSAIYPASRPITSTTNKRSCASAVSLILSIASTAVLTAVSNPIVKSLPAISLSIVPGIPIQGMSNSLLNFCAPLKLPSPPITTMPSIPLFLRLL